MFAVTGMPWSRSTDLKTSLSMQSAEASTPAPTYGHAGQLEQALHRAVLAERPVQDGEDHVDVGQRRGHLLARAGASAAVASSAPASSCAAPAPSAQPPPRSIATVSTSWPAASSAPITLRADAIEMSCSLERPPRTTAIRLKASAWSVVVVPSVVVCENWPTVIVTSEPGLAVCRPAGSG